MDGWRTPRLTFGSLFTGCGGLDLGLEKAGWECRWQVEADPHSTLPWSEQPRPQVLQRHWPDVPRYGYIQEVQGHELEKVDLIAGGFPCQDVSVAGRKVGLGGSRSGLWFEFHRLLTVLTPRWVLIENVPGLLSSGDGGDFALVLGGLTGVLPTVPPGGWRNSGYAYGRWYSVAWRVLDSYYFGVPQKRRRLFLVGHLGNGAGVADPAPGGGPVGLRSLPATLLFERGCCLGDDPARLAAGQVAATGVSGAIAGNRGPADLSVFAPFSHYRYTESDRSSTLHNMRKRFSGSDILVVRTAQTKANGWGVSAGAAHTLDRSNSQAVVCVKRRGGYGWSYTAEASPTLESEGGTHQGAPERVPYVLLPASGNGDHGDEAERGPDTLSHTELCAPVRRFTPVECERLQGFPDGWTARGQGLDKTEVISDSARYEMIGNAVTVAVGEWLGRQLRWGAAIAQAVECASV